MSTASSALTLALGAGGGLAAWYLMRDDEAAPASEGTSSVATAATPSSCALRLDPSGLTADGARVALADAIERCKAAGRADVTVLEGAPAATYAELMIALDRAGVRTSAHRNAGDAWRHQQRWARYTLRIYPQGSKGPAHVRWFRARGPIPWAMARHRLERAGVMDPWLAGKTSEPGGWVMSVDPKDFRADRAEPLPELRNAETSSTFTLAVYPQGDAGPKRVHWFYADPPTTWDDARDRLASARLIDLLERSPHLAGAWKLVTDPRVFDTERAKPLPGGTRDAARSARYSLEGRTILRDGEAILHLERVDLGDERYAITPHAADVLAQQIVDLLNGRRSRRQAQARNHAGHGGHRRMSWLYTIVPDNRPNPVTAGTSTTSHPDETSSTFTLTIYDGYNPTPRARWFYSDVPTTWANARDRLSATGLLDRPPSIRSRQPWRWTLSTDPSDFVADFAEPLPGGDHG